jgi:hypothetical protein
MPRIQNHFGHIWYGALLFTLVIWVFFKIILYQIIGPKLVAFFCKYACGYGLEDNREDPNHHRSIKHGCLVQFLIKQWLHVT